MTSARNILTQVFTIVTILAVATSITLLVNGCAEGTIDPITPDVELVVEQEGIVDSTPAQPEDHKSEASEDKEEPTGTHSTRKERGQTIGG